MTETKMMKIDELTNYPDKIYARSGIISILNRYLDKEVITSYIKNDFGCMFIIKGKIKAFAFVVIKRDLCSSFYNIEQLTPNKYFKFREEIEDKNTIFILDEQEEESIKAKSMLIELRKGDCL